MAKASIYAAEISGRGDNKEDRLTSRVFGALEILPKDKTLTQFLRMLATDRTYGEDENDQALDIIGNLEYRDLGSSEIELWKNVEGTFPDVYISTKRVLIIIEVKIDSKPRKDTQLIPQFEAAHKEAGNRKLAYFLLTKDYEKPVEAQRAENELKRNDKFRDPIIRWRRWSQVWKWLRDIEREELDKYGVRDTSLYLLDTTIRLMEVERMSGPIGFRNWTEVSNAFVTVRDFYSNLSKAMAEVMTELKRRNIKCIKQEPKLSGLVKSLEEWPTYSFRDEEWKKVKNPETDPVLQISFCLKEELEYQGPSVGLWWPINDEEERNEKEEDIRKQREKLGYEPTKFSVDSDESGIWIDNSPEFNQLEKGEQAVKNLVEKLEEMCIFVNSLERWHEELGIRNPEISRKIAK